jgi:hypothetical protein
MSKTETEDLDLAELGLYHKKDSSVPEEDYLLSGYTSMGKQLWVRKSEHGKKWRLYKDGSIAFGEKKQLTIGKGKKK